MADKVVVTKSKLDSLAQHINAKAGTTGTKTIAQMQNTVDGITGITQWNEKFTKILSPGTTETTAAITVKALCYYDGYWYGAGNDSAGDVYKLYGATASALTAVKWASSRAFPVKGITCDGTRVWLCFGSGAYKDRTTIYVDAAKFRSTDTTYSYSVISTSSSYALEDICRISDASNGSCVFTTGQINDYGLVVRYLNGGTSAAYQGVTAASGSFVSCCNWANKAIFVTANGYICRWAGGSTFTGQTLACLQGAKMVREMNGSLVVACVKSDGTYLYWFKSGADISTSQPTGSIKITSETLTIVGMAYAGGVYTVVGINSSGVTKVLQSDNLFLTGIYGQTVTLPSGYTPRVMATDGTRICILADNGSKVLKAMSTI